MNSSQYVDGIYLDKVQDWHLSDSPWKAANVYRMIEKHHLPINLIYDIGCGVGGILVELQKKMNTNVKFVGFDISPQAIVRAKPKENLYLKFYNEDFLDVVTPPPDLLLLLDVFEHIPDYIGFLEALRKRVDWIIFHIPLDFNAKAAIRKSRWMLYMRQQYGHLHYFTKETAIATLSDIGYDVVDYFYTDDKENDKPKLIRPRVVFEIRKNLYRVNQDLSASFFDSFNLMLLARGDLKKS